MTNSNYVGGAIRYLRLSQKLSQSDLSRLTGLKQNTISQHEVDVRGINDLDCLKYAEALGVTPSKLFELAKTHPSSNKY